MFMALSLCLSLASFYVALKFMPLDQLGMTPNFGPATVVSTFFVLAPFILLGAAIMTLVASFTKSYREAQTWLSVVLLAPTLPILIVSILTLRPRLEFMFVPSLSQHLILVDMVKNEPLDPAARRHFRVQHTAAGRTLHLDLRAPLPPRRPARLTKPANGPTWAPRR